MMLEQGNPLRLDYLGNGNLTSASVEFTNAHQTISLWHLVQFV